MRSIPLLIISICLALGLVDPALAQTFSGRVVKVVDGDTIEVLHHDLAETVRLAEVDSPEIGQPYWEKARQFTADQVAGQSVTVEVAGKDRNQATLAEVFFYEGGEKRSLNRELVRAGYAWWQRSNSQDFSLEKLEQEARAARRGLWADVSSSPPWEYRNRTAAGLPQWLLQELLFGLLAFSAAVLAVLLMLKLRARQEKRKSKKEERDAIRWALFVLKDQHLTLQDLKRKYLDHFKDEKDRWLSLQPSAARRFPMNFDQKALQFLLFNDSDKLLRSLVIGQNRYFLVKEILERRNEIYYAFQKNAITIGVDKALDATTEEALRNATDQLYEEVGYAIEQLSSAADKLQEYLRVGYGYGAEPS